jgi:hypothetical protein
MAWQSVRRVLDDFDELAQVVGESSACFLAIQNKRMQLPSVWIGMADVHGRRRT